MAKFQKGAPGRPKGAKNIKKAIKVAEFVAEKGINVPEAWWNSIQEIKSPSEKAKAIANYYTFVGAPPKPEPEVEIEESVDTSESADILSIVKDSQ